MGEKYKAEDEEKRKTIQAKNELENMAYQMRNTLDDAKFKDMIKDEDKKKVQDLVKETIDWVDANPNAEREEYESKRKEIEEVWRPIITAAYGAQGGAPGGMPGMGGMPGGGMPEEVCLEWVEWKECQIWVTSVEDHHHHLEVIH